MILRIVAPAQISPKAQDLVEQTDFFCSERWASCYDHRFRRFFIVDEKENIVGKFAAFVGGRLGLQTLITPPFSPHIGLSVATSKNNPVKVQSFHKQIATCIAEFLQTSGYVYYKLDFPSQWTDIQPMVWKNLNTSVRYTYKLNISRSAVEIESDMDSSRRNKINKARRENLTLTHAGDIEKAMQMLRENLRDKPVKLHEPILRKILELLMDRGCGFWTVASLGEIPAAINICCLNGQSCYNLLSAIDRSLGLNAAGSLSLYESILYAKEKGISEFDFEGSVVPEIEEYFRSFGGQLTPYFSVQGGKWPWTTILKWRQKKRSA
jgi:hypothetical protein